MAFCLGELLVDNSGLETRWFTYASGCNVAALLLYQILRTHMDRRRLMYFIAALPVGLVFSRALKNDITPVSQVYLTLYVAGLLSLGSTIALATVGIFGAEQLFRVCNRIV